MSLELSMLIKNEVIYVNIPLAESVSVCGSKQGEGLIMDDRSLVATLAWTSASRHIPQKESWWRVFYILLKTPTHYKCVF